MVSPFFSTTPNPSFQKEGTSWQRLFTHHSILAHPHLSHVPTARFVPSAISLTEFYG